MVKFWYGISTSSVKQWSRKQEVLSFNFRISAASKANHSDLKEVKTSYIRSDQGYLIPSIADFEWAWEPADLIPDPFPNPNLGLSSNPDRIQKKEGGPEQLVDWYDIDWDRGRRKAAAHLARLREGDEVPSNPKADDQIRKLWAGNLYAALPT